MPHACAASQPVRLAVFVSQSLLCIYSKQKRVKEKQALKIGPKEWIRCGKEREMYSETGKETSLALPDPIQIQ